MLIPLLHDAVRQSFNLLVLGLIQSWSPDGIKAHSPRVEMFYVSHNIQGKFDVQDVKHMVPNGDFRNV